MRQKKSTHQIEEPHNSSHSKNPNSNLKITSPPNQNEKHSFTNNPSAKIQKDLFFNSYKQPELMNHKSLICCSSSEALLKLLKIGYVKLLWIKTPSRVVVFIFFLPSSYLIFLQQYKSLLVGFSIVVLWLFVARKIQSLKLFSDGLNRCTPVVWSIGSVNRVGESTVSGFVVKVYSNGDVYEGELYKGKCSGSGVYCYKLNGRYEGDWVDQKYDGYGVETWAKGSRYRGQYREGLRHGFGVYRFYVGDMYAGEWVKGQCHGFGVHTCEDGSKYFGEFKCGVKHGLGHYHFRNGDMYAGEYFADKMHGFGVYNFANGHRYEGGWHEGKRQGFGLYTFRNGDTQSGHWEDGVLSINPQYPLSVSHAKVLKAVEEARRIAEKAVAAMNVDEKVNRAVAAANRSANAARVAAVKAVQSRVQHYDDPTLVIV